MLRDAAKSHLARHRQSLPLLIFVQAPDQRLRRGNKPLDRGRGEHDVARTRLHLLHEAAGTRLFDIVLARSDGKLGPNLQATTTDCAALMAGRRGGAPGALPNPNERMQCGMFMSPNRIQAGGTPMTQLAALSRAGVAVRLMQGNRDVLMGESFAAHCGATLIADPALLDLYGSRTLAMHGDTLCTDDIEYMQWRAKARNSEFQARFLAQPIPERKRLILGMRQKSEEHKQGQAPSIMDVATPTVERVLRESGYPRMIHGHTHRPARHVHVVDGRQCERWVLNAWYERGGYLRCDAGGCAAHLL